MPPPERLRASTLLARTCDFCLWWDFPNVWVAAFIQYFEGAVSLGTPLEELTIQWRTSDGHAPLLTGRLQTPAKDDVPLPRHDFVFTRTSGNSVVVRSKCALHQFVNQVLMRRLAVYFGTTESDFIVHALLFSIVSV